MRADARALDLRLQERRERQAFGRGFDRSLLNAWAGAGYQSYFLRDRSGGHGVSPVSDSGPARILEPRSEMQGGAYHTRARSALDGGDRPAGRLAVSGRSNQFG